MVWYVYGVVQYPPIQRTKRVQHTEARRRRRWHPQNVVQVVACTVGGSDARQTYATRRTQSTQTLQTCCKYRLMARGATGVGRGTENSLARVHAGCWFECVRAWQTTSANQRFVGARRTRAASELAALTVSSGYPPPGAASRPPRRRCHQPYRRLSSQPRADRTDRRGSAPRVCIHGSDHVVDVRAAQAGQNTCWASLGCTAHRPRHLRISPSLIRCSTKVWLKGLAGPLKI